MGFADLDKKWKKVLETIDYAFQPIVNVYSGKTTAVEALIRDVDKAEFNSIDALFDAAYQENALYSLDIELRQIALKKFAKIKQFENVKLFFNIDNRITMMPDFKPGRTLETINKLGLKPSDLCFELSEKHQGKFFTGIDHLILNIYKQQGYRMAIDDFGVGFSGLQMLYNAEPDFLKIDRFFISGIEKSRKRRLFVRSIVEIAQSLGIQTVAEGVETREEFLTCKNLGCNMVQGFFVAKPTKKSEKLKKKYEAIEELHKNDKRNEKNLVASMLGRVEKLLCVKKSDSIDSMLELFRQNTTSNLLPVVGDDMSPVGIIREVDLKSYTYSPFGLSLLQNQTGGALDSLIKSFGCVDIHDSLDKILKIYSHNEQSDGVIVTQNGKYFGYLSAKEMLDMVNEKNLLSARGQNPLTGLPGNIVINEYINSATIATIPHVLVYFDLDNFKPFNDHYGFRNGDRVISLFADIVKKNDGKITSNSLAGHIGGDDFFLGAECDDENSFESLFEVVQSALSKFRMDVESFYSKEDREAGYIIGKNRDGKKQKFPMMTVSAAMLVVNDNPKKENSASEEQIALVYAQLKKTAKRLGGSIAVVSLM